MVHLAVIGAGGIGAWIASAGLAGGHAVTVCSRTPIDALVLETEGREVNVDASLVADPAGLAGEAADVVCLTTKAGDTASAAPWLDALCRAGTLVVVVQNGLDHTTRVAPHLPAGRSVEVVGGLAYVASERLAPGRVRHLGGDLLIVADTVEARVSDAVGHGGLVVRGTDDIHSAAWRKLLANIVANPLTALTMRRIGVMREPGIAEVARMLLHEGVAVGRADGADLDDELVEQILQGTDRYGELTGSSMLYDRMAGLPLEHQYLTGEVVRRGVALGVPVPVNTTILALLDAVSPPAS